MSFVQENLRPVQQNNNSDEEIGMRELSIVSSSESSDNIETQTVWRFSYGVYNQRRLGRVLNHIQEAFVQDIQLGTNQTQPILTSISHISFPYLRILNLQTNHIKNIQVLQYLKTPQLKQLNLKNNQVTNLRVLKKLKWSKVAVLSLQKNMFTSLKDLYCGGFEGLENLSLEDGTNQKISEDITQLIKTNSTRLKHLNCSSKRRIINPNNIMRLKERYKAQSNREQQQMNLQQLMTSQLLVIQRKRTLG